MDEDDLNSCERCGGRLFMSAADTVRARKQIVMRGLASATDDTIDGLLVFFHKGCFRASDTRYRRED